MSELQNTMQNSEIQNPSDYRGGPGRYVVVGPDGCRWPRKAASSPSSESGGEDPAAVVEMVEQPAKVMRIGWMIKQLLEEVRAAPLDRSQPGAG